MLFSYNCGELVLLGLIFYKNIVVGVRDLVIIIVNF